MERTESEVLAAVVGVSPQRAAIMLALAGGMSGLQGWNRQGVKLTARQDERLSAFFALEALHLGAEIKGRSVIREPEIGRAHV